MGPSAEYESFGPRANRSSPILRPLIPCLVELGLESEGLGIVGFMRGRRLTRTLRHKRGGDPRFWESPLFGS